MVEEKKAVRKTASAKSASSASVKAPAESAVWPFPSVEKTAAKAPAARKSVAKAAAEPAVKKPVAKTAKTAEKTAAKATPAAKKAAAAKKAPSVKKTPAAKNAKSGAQPSAQERYLMVQTAAYYIAEKSGFQGCSTDHWAAAEIEIAQKLGD